MRFYRQMGGPRYGLKRRKACLGGCGAIRQHDSSGEASYCDTLKIMQKSGVIKSYTSQKQFDLRESNGKRHGFHRPDFLVTYPNGRVEAHEFKNGLITKEWELKAALFTWCYPEIKYRVVTPRDVL